MSLLPESWRRPPTRGGDRVEARRGGIGTDEVLAPTAEHHVSVTTFGGLVVASDERSQLPRPWTVAQSHWAAELALSCPEGPILELCAGVGHIGLETARLSGRPVVQVEKSIESCAWARHNADRNRLGDRVDIRLGEMLEVLVPGERFPVIIADPPDVPSDEVGVYLDEPRLAIDGGPDGLDLLRRTLAAVRNHLDPQGVALLQVRGYRQAMLVKDELLARGPDLAVPAVRSYGPAQALMLLRAWY